jgi:hypothetical protein
MGCADQLFECFRGDEGDEYIRKLHEPIKE